MNNINSILKDVSAREYDGILREIYGYETLKYQRQRLLGALRGFEKQFGSDRYVKIFSAPGRLELCGNHTDHQWGNVLASAMNMDTIAIVSPNSDGVIRVKSEGYPIEEIAVSVKVKSDPNEYSPLGKFIITDLDPYPEEEFKSIALIRGIAARFYLMGKQLKGFDCYTVSNIISGVGLSSSAAFEVLLGTIINRLYMKNSVSINEIAEIGQFAESYYYKKPCGLMDQLASCLGGIQWIDFYDSDTPFVTNIDYDFHESGYSICILDPGERSEINMYEYNAILEEMKSVANFFGKNALSRVDESDFLTYIKDVRERCGDRAVLRAWHFFEEDKRAVRCAKLLQKKNINEFLNEINKSGRSSFMYMQNVYSADNIKSQPLSIALATCDRLLGYNGAFRIHGGSFGGTVQAFVPSNMLQFFKAETEKVIGIGNCHVVNIRKQGCVEIGDSYV